MNAAKMDIGKMNYRTHFNLFSFCYLNRLEKGLVPPRLTSGAGASIKPGVERSGTPGSNVVMNSEPVKRATEALDANVLKIRSSYLQQPRPTSWARPIIHHHSWW